MMASREMIEALTERGVIVQRGDGALVLTGSAWRQMTKHRTMHFVGFKDDAFIRAKKVFGPPDFIHRFWDARAVDEVVDGDVVVFAEGDERQPVRPFAYDDSAHF